MTTVRYLDRKLLRNIIRHTETHNRLQEENEMWRSRTQEEFGWKKGRRQNSGGSRDRFHGDRQMERFKDRNLAEDQNLRTWDAGLNEDIYRAELINQERWGHNGFMELYPEEFINKESMDEMSDEVQQTGKTKKKSKRKRKWDSVGDGRSSKRKKDHVNSSSSTNSDSASSDEESRPHKHRSKKHRSVDKIGAKSSEHHGKAASLNAREKRARDAYKSDKTHSPYKSRGRTRSTRNRAPSVDRREKGTRKHSKTEDGGNNDKRAPSSGREKSSHRYAKNCTSTEGRKRTSESEKQVDRKINGHKIDARHRPTEEVCFSSDKRTSGDLKNSNAKKRVYGSPIADSERFQSRMKEKHKKTKKSTKSDGRTSTSKHRGERFERQSLDSEIDRRHHKHKSAEEETKGSREKERKDKRHRWK